MKYLISVFLFVLSFNLQSQNSINLDDCLWDGVEIACNNSHKGYSFEEDEDAYSIMIAIDSVAYRKIDLVIVDDRDYPEDNLELWDKNDIIGYIEPIGGIFLIKYFGK